MLGVVYPPAEDLQKYMVGGLPNETMGGAFAEVAKRFPDRIALSDGDTALTFAELDALTDRVASGLVEGGLNPLDRAIFQIANSVQLVVCMVACLKAEIIPVCTLTAHRRAEIGYLAHHAKARAHFICSDDAKFDFVAFSREMRKAAPSLEVTIVARGSCPDGDRTFIALDAIAKTRATPIPGRESDPFQVAVFQLSGGTSGIPKIIPRFHNEYLYQLRSVAAWQDLNEDTVGFSPAPMMHNAPIVCYWGSTLWSGGEVVCASAQDPATLARVIGKRRPNWMSIPLPLVISMKNAGVIDREVFGKARMSTPNHTRRLQETTGATGLPLYGMTEGIISYGRLGDSSFVLENTVGRPVSPMDEFRIVDPESGQALPAGELGEFCFKGPSSSRGYYDAPERNKEAFTSDGFCRSGDLMRAHLIDGVTYLSFEGRLKDVVSRGGEKINCQEVERLLISLPGIGAVAIVPIPDPVYGERACAFVIPVNDRLPPTLKEIGTFLEAAGLAKYKWPERIEVVSEFPLTSSGKLSKSQLREKAAELIKREAIASVPRWGAVGDNSA